MLYVNFSRVCVCRLLIKLYSWTFYPIRARRLHVCMTSSEPNCHYESFRLFVFRHMCIVNRHMQLLTNST